MKPQAVIFDLFGTIVEDFRGFARVRTMRHSPPPSAYRTMSSCSIGGNKRSTDIR